MDDLYPPSPAAVPPDLLVTPTSYWVRLALAIAAIGLLGLFYLGLVAFLLWHAWFAFMLAPAGAVGTWFSAVLGLVIVAMMVAPLMSVRSSGPPNGIEVTAEAEPALVQFVHRVADEVGAPRPYRIWLTPDVNAAVFFDVSLLALLFPTRKSLMLGLGLVNQLTLDELKAVLAHEFGHFAQGSMRVNAWAYVANQVAAGVVHMRTMIDTGLRWLSYQDPRVGWVGWLLRAIAWAIRTCTDTLFRLVLGMNRALSREMEFQADLVAARAAGSDSPVAALSRIAAADEALDMALREVGRAWGDNERVTDLYAVQTHLIGRLRAVRHEPTWGATPARPEPPDAAHRVFSKDIGIPPRMYLTHPPNPEREENLKRHYIPSTLDPRPAWALFADPAEVRARMTALLFQQQEGQGTPTDVPVAAFCTKLDARLDKIGFNPRHRGVYLTRPSTRSHLQAEQIWGDLAAVGDPTAILTDPYPDHLGELLTTLRGRNFEIGMLEALQSGDLEAPGGRIELRGEDVPRHRLEALIGQVKAEREEVERALVVHDQRVRAAHRLAARALGRPHEEALVGITRFLHYVEHQHAVLDDEENVLIALFRQLTLDGSMSSGEQRKLQDGIRCLADAVRLLTRDANVVVVPSAVVERLSDCADWPKWVFAHIHLDVPASLDGEWFQHFTGVVRETVARLQVTATATLDALLDLEDEVARATTRGEELPEGRLGTPGKVPAQFSTLAPGAERARVLPPGIIDRFKLGIGPFWSTVRAALALAVLGAALAWMVGVELSASQIGELRPRR